jgi:hypothetical protein
MRKLLATILSLFLLVGCASTGPYIIRMSDFGDYNAGMDYWIEDITARFDNPVILICHGNARVIEIVGPIPCRYWEWYLYPDAPGKCVSAQTAVNNLRRNYPERPIVVMSCNPGRNTLYGKTSGMPKRVFGFIQIDVPLVSLVMRL